MGIVIKGVISLFTDTIFINALIDTLKMTIIMSLIVIFGYYIFKRDCDK